MTFPVSQNTLFFRKNRKNHFQSFRKQERNYLYVTNDNIDKKFGTDVSKQEQHKNTVGTT